MRRMPTTIPVAEIEAAVKTSGGHYPHGEVRRYHAALNFLTHKHFVILSGLSGTGKTQLALRYARAVHGISDSKRPDPFLLVCAVRPEWTDPTGLTGYYDVLSNRYVVPPFLEAVLLATAHPDSPVFVVLDEMNLARVEYYFSDVLSAIETGEAAAAALEQRAARRQHGHQHPRRTAAAPESLTSLEHDQRRRDDKSGQRQGARSRGRDRHVAGRSAGVSRRAGESRSGHSRRHAWPVKVIS